MTLKDKIKGLADKAKPMTEQVMAKAAPAAQKAAAKLDEKTHGKYHDKIEKVSRKARLNQPEGETHPPEGVTPPEGTTPPGGAAPTSPAAPENPAGPPPPAPPATPA